MPSHVVNKIPAVVLGCHKIGLGIIRALGEEQVPVVGLHYNEMDMGYVSKYVIASYQCPHPDHDEKGFLSFLLSLSSKWGGCILIPSDDATLIQVSKHKALLEEHFKVMASDWEITEKYIVKKHTYTLAHEIGIPAPQTLVPGELKQAIDFARTIGLPCLLKPTVGHRFFEIFRKKMIFIETIQQLEDAYKKTYDSGTEMMIQEFIPGDDRSGVNYNSFLVDGVPIIEVTAEKVRLSPIRTGFPRVVVSKFIPELLDPGRKILNALGYNGFSCTEFKRDSRNGIYKLMEINGRLNLSTPLSVMAGVNFPYISYLYSLTGEIPSVHANKFREGVYWIDIGKDIVETIRSFRHENFSISEYLRPYRSPHVYTILSRKDPLPLIKRSLDIFKAIYRRIVKSK
jgi:predicted ATP-grasp superfamily ATP-dependent carboligase